MEKEKKICTPFYFEVVMKRRKVIAAADNGEEYLFASVTDAVKILNIAPTTVKRHAENNTAVSTKLGVVVLKYTPEM